MGGDAGKPSESKVGPRREKSQIKDALVSKFPPGQLGSVPLRTLGEIVSPKEARKLGYFPR